MALSNANANYTCFITSLYKHQFGNDTGIEDGLQSAKGNGLQEELVKMFRWAGCESKKNIIDGN